jgi:hypothetical protein
MKNFRQTLGTGKYHIEDLYDAHPSLNTLRVIKLAHNTETRDGKISFNKNIRQR